MDQWPAWSRDGRTIAFHRVLPSVYGPPGAYVVPVAGGRPRLVAPGDFFWPRHLSFSPDGSRLACDFLGQVTIIDIATGETSVPSYTRSGVAYPAWSSDGSRIAYTRNLRPIGEPLDSVGIHLVSVETSVDHVLRDSGQVVFGSWPQWTVDGSLFAFVGNHPNGKTAVYVMTPDSVKHVAAIATGLWFERFQWIRPAVGDDRLLIQEFMLDGAFRGLLVTSDGRLVGDWPLPMSFPDAASTDGGWAVLVRGQPRDSMGVLFIQDATGRTRPRQLTSWEPASSAMSTSGSIWPGRGR